MLGFAQVLHVEALAEEGQETVGVEVARVDKVIHDCTADFPPGRCAVDARCVLVKQARVDNALDHAHGGRSQVVADCLVEDLRTLRESV